MPTDRFGVRGRAQYDLILFGDLLQVLLSISIGRRIAIHCWSVYL